MHPHLRMRIVEVVHVVIWRNMIFTEGGMRGHTSHEVRTTMSIGQTMCGDT